ncbi:hypothetical protein MTBBW1_2200029 [Desulfamplus magnetovallimortis]|uniref:Uncharacterized protein n=1 Tax=Desulfamplus magnetovallimortis TaxID=1246637 RepID=A0A1W1HDC4_9BACT|nr:hypothetical protein [Desulfamplus magnetovallimortis]SLM30375.1 hypothetical protein MTBBW1_2200029 [Desulfamplus magnetovallimortis]
MAQPVTPTPVLVGQDAVDFARRIENDLKKPVHLLPTQLFLLDNRTGCRLITVDAYNDSKVLKFYQKNDFSLFSEKDKNKKTRAMFFDLKRLVL